MALVAKNRWDVVFTFRDNNGKSSTASVFYPGALTSAQVETAAGLLYVALAGITDANLEGYTLSRTFVENALGVAPATSEVERKLYIPMGTATEAVAASINIPSPAFVFEQDGTDVPAPESIEVAALLTLLTNGGLGGGNGVSNRYGTDITRAGTPIVRHRTRKL